ncbi:hypothetical protein RhiirA4_431592, partial [Rhizophagus irregularis]
MSNQSNTHVPIGDSANLMINNSMHIDSTADPSTAKVHTNQKGDLKYQNSTPFTSNTIGTTFRLPQQSRNQNLKIDKGKKYGIFYFDMHKNLLRCLEAPHHWKIVQSHSLTQPLRQSSQDKKKSMTSSKGKAVDGKPKLSTHSRGKSHHNKRTETTRSLLTQLLSLLLVEIVRLYRASFPLTIEPTVEENGFYLSTSQVDLGSAPGYICSGQRSDV